MTGWPSRSLLRFVALLGAVVIIPWLATLAAALIAAGGLADRGAAARAEIVGQSVAADVERALTLGVPLDKLAGMDDFLTEAMAAVPAIKLTLVADGAGRTLFQKADRARPELSVRLSLAEVDWPKLGLVAQRFPIRLGSALAGEVILGREVQALPVNTHRLLIDFAVALSIALATGALLLRILLRSLFDRPLDLALALDAALARGHYDRIAPAVEQSLIDALISGMNRLVVVVNERYARVRGYLIEVRDHSFAKDAPQRVAPLLAEIEGAGRFAPDRLAALTADDGGGLPQIAVFVAGAVLAIVAGMAAQSLALETALVAAGLGVGLAAPLAALLGRIAPVSGAALLALWGLLPLTGGAAAYPFAMTMMGALGAVLPWQAGRGDAVASGSGVVAFAVCGLVTGAALAVLCAGTAGSVLAPVAAIAGIAAGVAIASRSGPGWAGRVTVRQLVPFDRWWTGAEGRPRGWAVWTLTGLAVACAAAPDGSTDLRLGAEFVWLHTMPVWIAIAGVPVVWRRLPRGDLLYALSAAAAALALAADPAGRGDATSFFLVVSLGIAHAALAHSGDRTPASAVRGGLCLAAGLLAVWGTSGTAAGPALLAGAALLIAVSLLPPLAAGLWRAVVRPAVSGGREVS